MTNDRHPDERRALDGMDPPEQWDDIVARASGPEVVELTDRVGRSGRPRWIAGAVAAAVLLVVGAVAVLAFQGDDGEDDGGIAADGPAGVWGSRWTWVASTRGSTSVAATEVFGSGDVRVPELDLTVEGTVGYRGCNSGSGPARFENDRLVFDGGIAMTEMACADADGEKLMGLDARISSLLASNPTVSIVGDRLSLMSPSETSPSELEGASFVRVEENGPASMFDRRWTATSVAIDGLERDLHAAGGLVLRFEGEKASFLDVRCVPPYAGPLAGDQWSPVAASGLDCEPGADERYDWLTRLLANPGVGEGAIGPQPVAVALDGQHLTLSSEGVTFEFEESQDPIGLVATTWTVDRAVEGDTERTLLPDEGFDHVGFGVTAEEVDGETLTYAWFDRGCNGVGGDGGLSFDGDRLVPGAVGSRDRACAGADGEARMQQDEWFAEFLRAEPLVLFQGDRLVLWTNDARIELSRDVDPDEPVSSPPDTSSSGTTGSSSGSEPDQGQATPAVPVTLRWGCGPADGRTLEVDLVDVDGRVWTDSVRVVVWANRDRVADRTVAVVDGTVREPVVFEGGDLSSAVRTTVVVTDVETEEILFEGTVDEPAPMCG